MKKSICSLLLTLLAAVLLFSAVACAKVEKTGVWENATYHKDTEFGKGTKTIAVEVKAEEQSVTFTLHTDKETVGAALLEHQLIAGEEGAYGLYVKTVNGMLADYDVDQTYWSFSQDGTMLMTGVDTTPVTDGAHYELTRTK